MKRMAAVLCAFMLCITGAAGCKNVPSSFAVSDKIKVVCTIFPQYDWVRQILGNYDEDFEIKLLTDKGVDMHSYQPSTADIAAVASCDVLIYTGGESEKWIEDALKEAVNTDMAVINLIELLGEDVKEEELTEGMQQSSHGHTHSHEEEHEETHEGSHEHEENHNHEDEAEYDEHIWLSLKNAEKVTLEIIKVLVQKDNAHSKEIIENGMAYKKELEKLDEKYADMVKNAKRDTILFADRFPFRYLVDDYEIDYYAAFAGCSSETSASFKTIVFLSEKIDELGLDSILVIENSGEQVAKTITANVKNKNTKILTLDSMQSVTKSKIDNGYTYLSVMQQNFEVLCTALN